MKTVLLFPFLALALLSTQVNGQTLEFLLNVSDQPNDGVRYPDVDVTNAPAIIRGCSKLCAFGLWAMYTAVNFGAANPSTVTVYPVKGRYRFECTTSSAASVLRTIYSFRQIAPLNTATPPGTGVEYCTGLYFLGTCTKDLPAAGQESTVRSFGIQHLTNNYRICNAATTPRCLCLLAGNGPFLVPSVETWPAGNPIGTLAIFAVSPAGPCAGEVIYG